MIKKAIITGIYGQDGSYLAEYLIRLGYEVHGIIKKPLGNWSNKIKNYLDNKGIHPIIHNISLYDYEDVSFFIKELEPDECYHLAATHYSSSQNRNNFNDNNRILYHNNIISASNLMHAIVHHSPSSRFIQAGSCLMYDSTEVTPQNENIPYSTKSNYGLSKVAAAEFAKAYRSKGFHMSTAILFNHESPRRSINFVTQKIANGVAEISAKNKESLELGNIDSKKDWGYAPDYIDAMWRMVQLDNPEDLVLATGKLHSIEDFIKEAFSVIGISDWNSYIEINEKLALKTGSSLVGDAKRAHFKLGWEHTFSFKDIVVNMVENAIKGNIIRGGN